MPPAEHSKLSLESVEYPSSDGKPMAENTKQSRWIIRLFNNLCGFFHDQEVFIAADLLWYPVEGRPDIATAPNVMLVFGRPDGDRSSFLQWNEEGIAPQVVIEVLSPSNSPMEMLRKQSFYAKHGVEEFIVIDPGKKEGDPESFLPYFRQGEQLNSADFEVVDWISPRLGIRFRQEDDKVQVYYPDGKPFRTFVEVQAELEKEKQRADQAEAELERLRARLKELEE